MTQDTTNDAVTFGGPTLARWRNAVMAAFGLGGITVAAWGPRLPTVKAELGLGTTTIGLLLAGVTVGAIAGLVASTAVLHRLGSRGGVTAALLSVGGALAVMGAAISLRSLPLLSAGFVVVGFGVGTMDVLINVEATAIERSARRTLMPRMHGAWSVGAAVGSGIGAGCAALGVTPAMQFVGEGVLIAAVALVMAPAIPPGDRAPVPDEHASRARLAKVRHWLRGWLDWRLLLIGVVMFGVEIGEGSANNWLTLAVKDDHGQPAAVAALFFTAFATTEALARIFGGPVVDRLGRVRAIRCTTALGVAGMVLFILGGDTWAVLAGVVLWAVGVSMGFPLGMSAAAESGPDPVGRVSVVASLGYFANLAGPPAIGSLAGAAGLLNALWLIAALFLAAFAVAGSLAQRRSPA
ncbi:MAG TPA: MFS transporter [Acidimicrobiales bacterium]|nr:MFS transporter [Acidimicrobiales bacterium]